MENDINTDLLKTNVRSRPSERHRPAGTAMADHAERINKALFEISNSVNTTLNLNDLYRSIHQSLSSIVDVTNFFIALVDSDKRTLYFPYHVDTEDDDFSPINDFDTNTSLTGLVVLRQKPMLLKQKALEARAAKNGVWGPVPLIWMGVPLVVKDTVIGVVALQSYTDPHMFDDHDLEVLAAVSHQIAVAIDRKQSYEDLQKSEERYRSMMEQMTDAVCICSPNLTIEYLNPMMIKRVGRNAVGETCFNALHDFNSKCEWCVFDLLLKGESVETTIISPKDKRHFRVKSMPIHNRDGSVSKMAIYRDVTDYQHAIAEKETAEALLQQAQKMESIGTLAGGIAHDFNNILYSLIGYTELARDEVEKNSRMEDYLEGVYQAGNRARDLVKQILTFARKANQRPRPLNISVVAKEVLNLLRSTIPADIEIRRKTNNSLLVIADPTQIHQIFMNICTNAAHAMEDSGGLLDIEITDEVIDSPTVVYGHTLIPGNYVKIRIADTGTGISEDNIQFIFEPYYTTKELDKGTGLGLAVVHGAVKSCGGEITVDSKPEKGTTFIIYLPADKTRRDDKHAAHQEAPPRGTERILLVDDEVPITDVCERALSSLGYQVHPFNSSTAALAAFLAAPNDYDLAITDMTMPKMTGDMLAENILAVRPDFPIILSTGYNAKISSERINQIGIKAWLYKPVFKEELARKVRDVLDRQKH
jgi:signal transduction histidine kinase/CheY-like chemotaxis protein/PAS domain-containing protein